MNIDHLIKMANEISAFFDGESGEQGAPAAVANHLRRYWDPRMRAQIIAYVEERAGGGLVEPARQAVLLLAQERHESGGATPSARKPA